MGRPLKEALKSICGINRWSYAVFWKIGVQNPRLLIWEDCYYLAVPCSNPLHKSHSGSKTKTLEELERCWVDSNTCGSQSGSQGEDKVQLLVNKMMVTDQVHVVGQGLIGRTAYTGNHQWIVSGNYNGNGHPPEVVSEVLAQFSAGMQTLAVIPVLSLGVVQLGSSLPIMKNNGFVQSVRDLILQLDHIPGAFLPDNFISEESSVHYGVAVNGSESSSVKAFGNINELNSSVFSDGFVESCYGSTLVNHSSQSLVGRTGDHLQAPAYSPTCHGRSSTESFKYAILNQYPPSKTQLSYKSANGEVISIGSDVILDQQSPSGAAGYCGLSHGQPANGTQDGSVYMEKSAKVYAFPGGGVMNRGFMSPRGAITPQANTNGVLFPDSSASWKSVSTGLSNGIFSSSKVDNSLSNLVNESIISDTLTSQSYSVETRCKPEYTSVKKEEKAVNVCSSLLGSNYFSDLENTRDASQQLPPKINIVEDTMIESRGDDLFDVLGKEFKNRMLSGYTCNANDKAVKSMCQDTSSILNIDGNRTSKNCYFRSDHLLEAVVSGIHPAATQTSDNNISCRTTLTKASGSCTSNCSSKYGPIEVSNQKCALSGHSKLPLRSHESGPTFGISGFVENGSKNSPQASFLYGSPVSSWLEQTLTTKCETSITSGNSKKADTVGKPNRKRLKSGENPRPRPKDRQLIQDRVKELREMIPSGAKCSIDALLERTIKHMLFLQSIMEHAGILKPMADSKVVNRDGDLLLKDNFEGGATWAYEVGSKATVCPVVVEDLAPPRRFLVVMLCEENGLFLEIADLIRGMGLGILNGVMEAQNKKTWARFAVEANRDITRMEVFISLVQLLEQMSAKRNVEVVEDDMLICPASVTGNMQQQLLIHNPQVMC